MLGNLRTDSTRVAPADGFTVLLICTKSSRERLACCGVLQVNKGAGRPSATQLNSTASVSLTTLSLGESSSITGTVGIMISFYNNIDNRRDLLLTIHYDFSICRICRLFRNQVICSLTGV